MNDSKHLWLSLRAGLTHYDVRLGTATAQGYVGDPRMVAFVASRYKFCAKMLEGMGSVVEIGCGDAFGSPIVAQSVGALTCTDIDEETLVDNRERCRFFPNMSFKYHDFRAHPFSPKADAVYLVDVIEHVFPEEMPAFMTNLAASVREHGIVLIGTPNKTSEQYASENSKVGHVNVMTGKDLRAACARYFHNVFMFGMNDEVVHTGYLPMAHYLWALCVAPFGKRD